MIEAYEFIKKHGINAVLFFALYWMNGRLESVEDKLFNCYDKLTIQQSHTRPIYPKRKEWFAIIPRCDINVKRNIQPDVKKRG